MEQLVTSRSEGSKAHSEYQDRLAALLEKPLRIEDKGKDTRKRATVSDLEAASRGEVIIHEWRTKSGDDSSDDDRVYFRLAVDSSVDERLVASANRGLLLHSSDVYYAGMLTPVEAGLAYSRTQTALHTLEDLGQTATAQFLRPTGTETGQPVSDAVAGMTNEY